MSVAYRLAGSVRRAVRGIGLSLMRVSNRNFRAFTDIFFKDYEAKIDWKSGLGESRYILYALVRALRPEVVVEIGSARGLSTCTLALACKQNGRGRVYAIDPHTPNDWTEMGVTDDTFVFLNRRLKDYGLEDWCEVIRSSSVQASEAWSKPIDLMFIDGDHAYEGVKSDFESFSPWLSEDSVVLFHDSLWGDSKLPPYFRKEMGVPKYLAELREAGFQSFTVQAHPGLTLLHPKIGGFAFYPEKYQPPLDEHKAQS